MDLDTNTFEIFIGTSQITLSSFTWKCFAYLKLISLNNVYTLKLESDFSPFYKFLNKEKMSSLDDAIVLREQLLIFGLEPTSIVASQATMYLTQVINSTWRGTSCNIWNILQIGWNEFSEDDDNFNISFIRSSRIQRILLMSILPLKDYTIDVLNTEILQQLKKKSNNELSERDLNLKMVISTLFDKKTYPSNFMLFQ